MYELFEHTADLGLRVQAPLLDVLFAEAAEALFTAIIGDLSCVRADQKVEIRVEGDEPEYLLFDWLKELLFQFDSQHLLFRRFEATVTPSGLTGRAWGEPYDPDRHLLEHEVKAITYHQLKVEPTDD